KLSVKLCEAWGWSQANGHPRDMVCRSLMLELHRAGLIELPPVRQVSANPLVVRHKPAPVAIDTAPIEGSLRHLPSIEFRQVRRTADEAVLNGLIEQHHYLGYVGYVQPVGEHLKFLVFAGERPVARSEERRVGKARRTGWVRSA